MSQEPAITMKKLDSYISEAINQLRNSKKQPNENAIFNLLLEKLGAIAINKEQLTERLNYIVVFHRPDLLTAFSDREENNFYLYFILFVFDFKIKLI